MKVNIPSHVEKKYFINHVIHYGRIKSWAYNKSMNLPHGSDVVDLDIYHSLYLTNLFALLDEYFDGHNGSILNYWDDEKIKYAKHLRNFLIHRGGCNNAGTSDGIKISSILPEAVSDQSKKNHYPRPYIYYHELFRYLEETLNPLILETTLTHYKNLCIQSKYLDTLILEELHKIEHMPEWTKEMAKSIPDHKLKEICQAVSRSQPDILRKIFG